MPQKQLRTDMPSITVRIPQYVIDGIRRKAKKKDKSMTKYIEDVFKKIIASANSY